MSPEGDPLPTGRGKLCPCFAFKALWTSPQSWKQYLGFEGIWKHQEVREGSERQPDFHSLSVPCSATWLHGACVWMSVLPQRPWPPVDPHTHFACFRRSYKTAGVTEWKLWANFRILGLCQQTNRGMRMRFDHHKQWNRAGLSVRCSQGQVLPLENFLSAAPWQERVRLCSFSGPCG